MNDEEKIVLREGPEAAVFETRTLTGWWSRNGKFYGEGDEAERRARYDGSTHHTCECGKIATKNYTCCDDCRQKNAHDRFMALPYVDWDGVTPVFSDAHGRFFWDSSELDEFYGDLIEDGDIKEGDAIDLFICEPNYLHEVDPGYWADLFPTDGDGELPKDIEIALDALNKALRESKPISWTAGKKRTSYISPTHEDGGTGEG